MTRRSRMVVTVTARAIDTLMILEPELTIMEVLAAIETIRHKLTEVLVRKGPDVRDLGMTQI